MKEVVVFDWHAHFGVMRETHCSFEFDIFRHVSLECLGLCSIVKIKANLVSVRMQACDAHDNHDVCACD